jgi:ankyrin repeat protein
MAPSDILMALYTNDRDGADALAQQVELTLPELAAFGNVGRLTQHLVRHPESVHVASPDGWTALHLAAWFGYAAVTVRLLRSDASHAARSTNLQGNTPLHAAIAGRRELPVITALLAAGSDAGAVDAQGYTPLHLAASRGDVAVVELLMACGADPGVRTPDGRLASDLARDLDHPDLAALLTPR